MLQVISQEGRLIPSNVRKNMYDSLALAYEIKLGTPWPIENAGRKTAGHL